MSDALTNAGKRVTSKVVCADSQQYIKRLQSSDFPKWLCALGRNLNSSLLSDQNTFQML